MESKKEVGGVAIVLAAFCILASVLGAISLEEIISHLNKWQKGGYAIAAGVFIAMSAVILNQILSFFQNEKS